MSIVLPERFTYRDSTHVYQYGTTRLRSITSLAGDAADKYAMHAWRERQIAIGVAIDPRIREDVATFIDNNERMNELCEEALKFAGGMDAARKGTQVHAATERHDLGAPLLTDMQQAHAAQYQRAVERYGIVVDPRFTEAIMFHPDHLICGRPDRAAYVLGDSRLAMVDVKTGYNAVKYPHSTAVQLALQATLPLIAEETHTEEGGALHVVDSWMARPAELRSDIAYVLYLPTDPDSEGVLYRFTLDGDGNGTALRAMLATVELRHYRLNDNLVQRVDAPLRPAAVMSVPEVRAIEAAPVVDLLAHRQQMLVERIMGLADVDRDALRADWQASSLPSIGYQLTAAQLEVAEQLVDAHDPFMLTAGDVEQPTTATVTSIERPPAYAIDEAEMAATADMLATSAKYARLDPAVLERINTIQTEAAFYSVGFHAHERPSLRRILLVDTLMFLSEHDALDDESLRMLTTLATDDQTRLAQRPLGWCVGAMTTEQVVTFATLAGRFVRGQLTVRFTDDDRLVVDPSSNTQENQ